MPTRVHFILYVADQGRSARFYEAVLRRAPRLHVPGMTEFELPGGALLGLMPEAGIRRLLGDALPDPASAAGKPRAELYLVVGDPAAWHGRALRAGARELSAPLPRDWGHVVAYALDPDGHVIAFAAEIDRTEEILTDRLRLVPMTADHIEALRRSSEALASRTGFRIPPSWPAPDLGDLLDAVAESLAEDPSRSVWHAWMIVDRAENAVVGDAGYFGPPDETGRVEIGYSIVPERRRRGFAFEAAAALVERAFREGATVVEARTEEGGDASVRLLKRLGMNGGEERRGEHLVWRLTRDEWKARARASEGDAPGGSGGC